MNENNNVTIDLIKLDSRIKDHIARMSLKNIYWGYMFSRVKRIADSTLPSIAGVSFDSYGKLILLYNPVLYDKTDDKNFELVLEHEGLHLINKHISRFMRIVGTIDNKKRIQEMMKAWNYAADCCVNIQGNIPDFVEIAGNKWPAHKPKMYDLPDGNITEWYYHKFLEKQDEERAKNKNEQSESNESGNGDGEESTQSSGGQDTVDGNGEGTFDDHSKWIDGDGKSDPTTIARRIENNTNKLIKEALKNFDKKRGHIPGYLEDLIEEALTPPKVPYYQIIKKLIRGSRLSKFRRTPTRINRKRVYTFLLNGDPNIPKISPFPGRMRDYSFNIGILLDTSGSMSKDEILEGLSSIKNVFENDRHCRVHVIENDTKVQKEYEIKKIKDIQFNIKGRGGTVLRPGLKRMSEINPDVVLCFTDAECDNIHSISKKELPKKIIWVVPKNAYLNAIQNTGIIVKVD